MLACILCLTLTRLGGEVSEYCLRYDLSATSIWLGSETVLDSCWACADLYRIKSDYLKLFKIVRNFHKTFVIKNLLTEREAFLW